MKKKREKGQQVVRILLIIVLGIVISILAGRITSAASPTVIYNTSQPIIAVEYFERPVTIENWTLIHQLLLDEFYVINTTPIHDNMSFNFTSEHLIGGNYTFTVCARDRDYNHVCGAKDFTVNTSNDVWLINPLPLGIGKSPQYNISFESRIDMQCRYAPKPATTTPLLNLHTFYLTALNMDASGNTSHNITNILATTSPQSMYAICRIANAPSGATAKEYYRWTLFHVGYDTTAPIISLTVDPNPIIDSYERKTFITAKSLDDTVLCHIKNNNSNTPEIAAYFNGTNPYALGDYRKENNYTLDLSTQINDNTPRVLYYNISCNNTAQLQYSELVRIEYTPANTIGIIQVKNFSATKTNVAYHIKTTISAEYCKLGVNGQDLEDMTSVQNSLKWFTKTIPLLEEGVNSMTVECLAKGVGAQNITTFNFTVDSENPQLNISLDTKTCSLNQTRIKYIAYDNTSGIEAINYTVINQNQQVFAKGTILLTENTYDWQWATLEFATNLQENTFYEYRFIAIDKSGRVSPEIRKQNIKAVPRASPGCAICNDHKIEGYEECDFDNTGIAFFTRECNQIVNPYSSTHELFFGGKLRCKPDDCTVDLTNCEKTNSQGYCGDKIINNFNYEQCDGDILTGDWGKMSKESNKGCQMLGFSGGTLTCNPPWTSQQCEFNTSQCTVIQGGVPYTKDTVLVPGEQCDKTFPFTNYLYGYKTNCTFFDGFTNGTLGCGDTDFRIKLAGCIKPAVCGDGTVSSGEECEPGDNRSCYNAYPDLYIAGNLTCIPKGQVGECTWNRTKCSAQPRCSNGIIEFGEKCDGTNIDNKDCTGFTYGAGLSFKGGILGCSADCKSFNTQNCQRQDQTGYCGDNNVNQPYIEQCDGNPGEQGFTQLQSWGKITSCEDLGFESGTLRCAKPFSADQCKFNTSECIPKGSDPIYGCSGTGTSYITPNEQCQDGIPFNRTNFYATSTTPLDCTDFAGYIGGNLSCANCKLDFSKCFTGCGDNFFDSTKEICEKGSTPNCAELNSTLYSGGTATCASDCKSWDTTTCNKRLPELSIDASNKTCSLTTITFRATVTPYANPATGIRYSITTPGVSNEYYYPIALATNPSTYSITTSLALLNEKMYTITARVNDSEGKESIVQSKNITAINENSVLCEKIPPQVTVTITTAQNGYAANAIINCADTQSGCSEKYLYTIIAPNAQCNLTPNAQGIIPGAILRPYTLPSNPFSINHSITGGRSETKLCIAGYDNAGNVAYTEGIIKIIIPVCKNGIIEGNEQCEWNNTQIIIRDGVSCTKFEYDPGSIYGMKKSGTGKFYTGGILGCAADCTLQFDNCNYGKGYCGDNNVNEYYYETCDGTQTSGDWGRIGKGNTQKNGCIDLGFSGGTLTCNPPFSTNQCQFNTSGCTGSVFSSKTVGNGELDPGEQCDPGIITTEFYPYNASCSWFDSFVTGKVSCKATGMLDISGCSDTITPGAKCGNGVRDSDEECDFDRLKNKYVFKYECEDYYYTDNSGVRKAYGEGILSCKSDCTVNTNNCEKELNSGYCGDGKINDFYNEQCDGSSWGGISKSKGCQDLGFESGTLTCNNVGTAMQCKFNTSNCVGKPDKPYNCGDNYLGKNEQCDPTVPFNSYKSNLTCTDFDGFSGGTLKCFAKGSANECQIDISGCIKPTVCGDGNVTPLSGEECELGMTRNCSTAFPGTYTSGVLKCKAPSSCTWDKSNCSGPPVCGNEKVESSNNEQCDGTNLNGASCTLFNGFSGGTLKCRLANSTTDKCMWDTTKCTPLGNGTNGTAICGDGKIQAGEQCEIGTQFNATFWKTKLGCSGLAVCSGCMIKCTTQSTQCQNTVKDGTETDIDCGGTCSGCALNKSCSKDTDCDSLKCGANKTCVINPCKNNMMDANESDIDCGGVCTVKCGTDKKCNAHTDCTSGVCDQGKCSAPPCDNGRQDTSESDIDCGGKCNACNAGKKCIVSEDCASNNCIEGICSTQESKITPETNSRNGIIMIIGILCIVLGAGYVAYRTFIAPPQKQNTTSYGYMQDTSGKPLSPQMQHMQEEMRRAMLQKEHERSALIQKKLEEKKFAKEQAHATVLDKLEDKKPAVPVEEKKATDTTTNTYTDYVDMDALTNETKRKQEAERIAKDSLKKKSGTFSKLEGIEKGKDQSSKEFVELDVPKNSTKNIKTALNTAASSTEEKTTAVDDPFKKLAAMGSTKPLKDVALKIGELSGKDSAHIDKLLAPEALSAKQTVALFDGLDRSKLTSEVFKDIIGTLLKSGKISRESVTNILFEYMDKGTITKGDVAKIATELGLMKKE